VFQDFHINSVSCVVEKIIPVTKRKDNKKVAIHSDIAGEPLLAYAGGNG
jgi:hypothetical protein